MSRAIAIGRAYPLAKRPSGRRPKHYRAIGRRAAVATAALSLSIAAAIAAIGAFQAGALNQTAPGDPAWDSARHAVLADPAWDSTIKPPQQYKN